MKRRKFLKAAAIAGAATALPMALSHAVASAPPPSRFVLARAMTSDAGTAYRPLDGADCSECAVSTVRVRMDGMHVADGGAVLRALSLHAMFDVPGAPRAPFTAWHYAAGAQARTSQRLSFVAGRANMRGFELEYRVEGDTGCVSERCDLTRFEAPLLEPGHYVLLGPRRNGERADPAALVHSGDSAAPLAMVRDFDYLAFRIEATA
jgi:hypothetical protein